jgi:hypothetical protein
MLQCHKTAALVRRAKYATTVFYRSGGRAFERGLSSNRRCAESYKPRWERRGFSDAPKCSAPRPTLRERRRRAVKRADGVCYNFPPSPQDRPDAMSIAAMRPERQFRMEKEAS